MEKSIFNFKVLKSNGNMIDLHQKNLWVSSFRIFSPSPEHYTEIVEGRHGSIYLGTTLKERKIFSRINVEALDPSDFDLFRDEIFRIFNPLEKFYIIRDLQPGKRMEVSVSSEFDIDYTTLEDGEFSIEFVIHSVFLESIGTTLDPLNSDTEIWQIGQGLILDDISYIHNTNTFSIFNAGDIEVHPKKMPLIIKYKGSSNNLEIKNLTSGDTWQYFGETSSGDVIEINRVKHTKNGTSIFANTNKKFISIKPGLNEFELNGTNGTFEISFDFRFYYL